MANASKTWQMIHSERAALAEMLEDLTPQQWAASSLCAGWTVREAAAHVLLGAEQTPAAFFRAMAANGFRFNTMIDRAAHKGGALTPAEIIGRLQARTTTTNHPPGPAVTMLGEVVVHGEDIRRPLGISGADASESTQACLDLFKGANFPLGTKTRIAGLRLVATDLAWSHGAGPEVSGPGRALLVAMTGRSAGLEGLSGDGAPLLASRLGATKA